MPIGVPTSSTPSFWNFKDDGSSERKIERESLEQVVVYRVAFFILMERPQSAKINSICFQKSSVRADGSAIMLISSRRPNENPAIKEEPEDGKVSNELIFLITGFCMARQNRKDPKVHPCLTFFTGERKIE